MFSICHRSIDLKEQIIHGVDSMRKFAGTQNKLHNKTCIKVLRKGVEKVVVEVCYPKSAQ